MLSWIFMGLAKITSCRSRRPRSFSWKCPKVSKVSGLGVDSLLKYGILFMRMYKHLSYGDWRPHHVLSRWHRLQLYTLALLVRLPTLERSYQACNVVRIGWAVECSACAFFWNGVFPRIFIHTIAPRSAICICWILTVMPIEPEMRNDSNKDVVPKALQDALGHSARPVGSRYAVCQRESVYFLHLDTGFCQGSRYHHRTSDEQV